MSDDLRAPAPAVPKGADSQLAPPELVLVRYGELALKRGNRREFENRLIENIHAATDSIARVKVHRNRGRLAVEPERRGREVAERLRDVFGIASISPAWGVDPELAAIRARAHEVLGAALATRPGGERVTFRVATNRADKSFPMRSCDLDREVADHVLPSYGERLTVRLKDPELELGIDVRAERAYVFAERLAGPGGLPVGSLGRGLCLLSGGIDSPVAAWAAMKRGLRVGFVSFHSPPYIGESSRRKVVQLVGALARFQPRNRLFVVPFTESQEAIRDRADSRYRTILYRRMMQRIASRLADRFRAGALITGESLGQVASQTLENMTCIEDASSLPVLRPLVTFDKQETIAIAQRIGTLPISNLPEPDCCTVFQPPKPVIRGRIAACVEDEAKLDVAGLVERAVAGVEIVDV